MAIVYNQGLVEQITRGGTDAAQVINNIDTLGNTQSQFSDSLGAALGLGSLLTNNPALSGSLGHAGLIASLNNVFTHSAQGDLEAQHVIDFLASLSSFATTAAELARLTIPQLRALSLAMDAASLLMNYWPEIVGAFPNNSTIDQNIRDFDSFLNNIWNSLGDDDTNHLDSEVDAYNQFLNWVQPPRRDPLALDLGGDGIETLAADGYNGVLFDQNGDGVKRATGWVAADDGLLVLDRNGNGTIDNGTELFGNNTPTTDGTAANGLAALSDIDSNADGVINASDAQFADLRVWRDLNSDGISQGNELFTLNDLGIASLSTGGSLDVNTDLGNGNSIVNQGTFTWADGRKGNMADLALQEQTVYRQFTDNVAITAAAQALPDIVATGPVRDLREAMSLDTSGNLTNLVTQYSAATTRAEQQTQLDTLLTNWAATSGFETSPGNHTRQTTLGDWPVTVNYTFAGIDPLTQLEEYAAALDRIRVLMYGNIAASNDAVFCYNNNDIKLAVG